MRSVARLVWGILKETHAFVMLRLLIRPLLIMFGPLILLMCAGYGWAKPSAWHETAAGLAIGLLLFGVALWLGFRDARRWRWGWRIAALVLLVFGLIFAGGHGYQTYKRASKGDCLSLAACVWSPTKEVLAEIVADD